MLAQLFRAAIHTTNDTGVELKMWRCDERRVTNSAIHFCQSANVAFLPVDQTYAQTDTRCTLPRARWTAVWSHLSEALFAASALTLTLFKQNGRGPSKADLLGFWLWTADKNICPEFHCFFNLICVYVYWLVQFLLYIFSIWCVCLHVWCMCPLLSSFCLISLESH